MRSRTSRPSRRVTNEARLSSSSPWAARRGSSGSIISRSLPRGESSGLRNIGSIRAGASSEKPSGMSISAPLRTTRVRRNWARVAINSCSRPRRRARWSAQGFSVRNESAPPSATKPCSRMVQSAPPRRSPCSSSAISSGTRCIAASSRSLKAALRPLMPPPRTAIRAAPLCAIRSLSDGHALRRPCARRRASRSFR